MMAFRVVLAFLMVALAAMATAAGAKEHAIHFGLRTQVDGHGLVADALELDEELLMQSESARRQLGQAGRYISYGALNRNNVPCNRRGRSYYNCNSHQKANPYSRGCTRITNCARNNH